MRLVDQWREIERGLPDDWMDARLALQVVDADRTDRAAALLGPLTPGRAGTTLRLFCARRGAGPGPEAVRRLLALLDAERIAGELELVAGELELVAASEPATAPEADRSALAASWDAAVSVLPDDWSDMYAEVELRSTDHLERAALLMAPLNPSRYGGPAGFRFRVAQRFGYGASPRMARRCLERCDDERIRGELRILRVLCDTDPVDTQGPVWYVGGRPV